MLAWPLLISLAGTAGGLLRGWKPGHRLAALIDRYIGWKRFWEGIGLVAGIDRGHDWHDLCLGDLPGDPRFCSGRPAGIYLGRKIWQFGEPFGWERIWGAISGLGFGALGFGLAQLLGVIGLNILGGRSYRVLQPLLPIRRCWAGMDAGRAAGGALAAR